MIRVRDVVTKRESIFHFFLSTLLGRLRFLLEDEDRTLLVAQRQIASGCRPAIQINLIRETFLLQFLQKIISRVKSRKLS